MKISQQVYLNCAKHLSAFLPCAAAFFDLQGTALACTDPARSDYAQVVVYQCMREPDQAKKLPDLTVPSTQLWRMKMDSRYVLRF